MFPSSVLTTCLRRRALILRSPWFPSRRINSAPPLPTCFYSGSPEREEIEEVTLQPFLIVRGSSQYSRE